MQAVFVQGDWLHNGHRLALLAHGNHQPSTKLSPQSTNPLHFLQWVGKFALQLLVAKEAWKHLSGRYKNHCSSTYENWKLKFFRPGESASLWNSSMAEMGRWWNKNEWQLFKLSYLIKHQIAQASELGNRVEDWVTAVGRYNFSPRLIRTLRQPSGGGRRRRRRRWRSPASSAATKGGRTEWYFANSLSTINIHRIYAVSPNHNPI